MSASARMVIAAMLGCFAVAGCEDQPPPPAERVGQPNALPAIDYEHSATIRADRQLRITNLVLVLQRSPLRPNEMGVSLTTTRTGPDGSRLIFGTFVRARSIDELAESDIHLSTGPVFNPNGSGIFTSLAAYQPKFVTLRITAFDEKEARGSFSGDFYRFSTVRPVARPDVIEIKATFLAALIVK